MPAVAALAPALGTAFVHTQLVCNVHTLAHCCSKVRLQCFMLVYASCSAYNVLLHNGCSRSVLWLLVLRLRCVHRDLGECDGVGLAPARKISQPQAVGLVKAPRCCGRPVGGCLVGGSGLVATSGAWTAAAGST